MDKIKWTGTEGQYDPAEFGPNVTYTICVFDSKSIVKLYYIQQQKMKKVCGPVQTEML